MDFWRQMDLVTVEALETPVTVIGAGGIGSPTVLALAKMGCSRLIVYDDDRIEPHNLPNQVYRLDQLGMAKVEALAQVVKDFTGVDLEVHCQRVEGQRLSGIVVSGVDSMASRSTIWHGSIRYNPAVQLYVDARMGAEVCRIYSIRPVDPDDVRYYERTLYSDDHAEEAPCTARAIIYNVLAAASLIANQVKKLANGEGLPREIILDLKTLTFMVS